MPANETAEAVAAELRTALEGGAEPLMDALGDRYAEKVEVVHEPAIPQDGVIDGAVLRAHGATESQALKKAIPDFAYTGAVTVDGDDITIKADLSGTMEDGSEFAVTIPTTYTVKDGEVVRIFAAMDPAAMEPIVKALMAGGFEIPS